MAETTTTTASQEGTTQTGQAAGAQQQGAQSGGAEGSQGATTTTTTAEQAAAAGAQGTTTTATTTEAAEGAVPERYSLTLPEGTLLDASDVAEVEALARTEKWTNEQAQATLTEVHTRLAAQAAAFRTELSADTEFGGAHLEGSQQRAVQVMDRFLPASHPLGARLRSTLNRTGYGNFLPLVALLSQIGKAMGEDQPRFKGAGAGEQPPRRSHADVMFGDAQGVKPPT